MFCKNCGNELKEDEKKCSNCGYSEGEEVISTPNSNTQNKSSKVRKVMIVIAIVLVLLLIALGVIFVMSSTTNKNNEVNETDKANSQTGGSFLGNLVTKVEESSPTKDTDLGLKSVKIDSTSVNLTEEQKTVLKYFDEDYLEVDNYEFLMRYPDIYKDSQVRFHGQVKKIISSNDTDYEMIMWVGPSEQYYYYWENHRSGIETTYSEYVEQNKNNYVVIKGKHGDVRLIEGDWVSVDGRYIDIESQTIDGTSYTIPTINVYESVHDDFYIIDGIPDRFDYKFIKKVANAIFSNAITIREATIDEAAIYSSSFMNNPVYVGELDNQSNAKFSKYFFNRNKGLITDVENNNDYAFSAGNFTGIERYIEFAPDFQHFFMFSYDKNFKVLTVEYYDKDFNKIWTREFEETEFCTYDYTQNNIYLVANNYLYTINTNTGEDTYSRKYVGRKLNIRKLEDGLLMFVDGRVDTVMKTDLEGNIIWTSNVKNDSGSYLIQIKNGTLITSGWDDDGEFYAVIDLKTGEIKMTAKAMSKQNTY